MKEVKYLRYFAWLNKLHLWQTIREKLVMLPNISITRRRVTLRAISMRDIVHKIIYNWITYPIIFMIIYPDIKKKISRLKKNENQDIAAIRKIQFVKLKKMINYASKKNHFYKSYWNQNGVTMPVVEKIEDISKIPIITKGKLREYFHEKKTYHFYRETTGTTGQPVRIFFNRNAISSKLAARYYFYSWHNIKIGDKEARFWGRRQSIGCRQGIKNYLLNRKIFNFLSSENEKSEKEAIKLISYNPDYFYGYSSLIYNAAIRWKELNCPSLPSLKKIICTAETLLPFQRKFISDVFNCPVVMEYGCTEVDIIAFECEYGTLHINANHIFLEVINYYGNNECVITDLSNNFMPIIRYKLGDECIVSSERCTCGRRLPVIENVTGRTGKQILELDNGVKLHAVIFAYMIEDLWNKGMQINQFKVFQLPDDKFEFYIDASDMQKRLIENELKIMLYDAFHDSASFKIIFDKIPERTGKFTYFEKIQ